MWKDRKAILPAIKAIYRAESANMAMVRLEEFDAEWGKALSGNRPGLAPSHDLVKITCVRSRPIVIR